VEIASSLRSSQGHKRDLPDDFAFALARTAISPICSWSGKSRRASVE
jgi:hypothetical protein